MSVYQNFLL